MSSALAHASASKASLRVVADVPTAWDVLDAPVGVHLVAADPERTRGVRSNLVITTARTDRPLTSETIDDHLESVLDELAEPSVEILDVIVDHGDDDLPDQPTQRIIMLRRFGDEVASADGNAKAVGKGDVVAEVCQQHRWIEGHIVIATVTTPAEPDADMLDDVLACLESVDLQSSAEMTPTGSGSA